MNFKQILQQMVAVERAFDVNSLAMGGLRLWPILREALYFQLRRPRANYTRRQWAGRKNLQARFDFSAAAALQACQGGQVVLYSIPQHYSDRINGRFYNRYLDPLIPVLASEAPSLKLELWSRESAATLPRAEPTLFLPPVGHELADAPAKEPIPGFAEFAREVRGLTGVEMDEELFSVQAQVVMSFRDYFKRLLEPLAPRAVLIPFYYNKAAMGLIWASRLLGAVPVDIQHGAMGPHHGMYHQWTRVPAEGYELLPEFWWTWGEEFCQGIARHQPPEQTHHLPVVGGNPHVTAWQNGLAPTDREEDGFARRLAGCGRVVLVALTRLEEHPLPEFLWEAMRQSPPDWLWLFRLHPVEAHLEQRLAGLLREKGVANWEVSQATRLRLYFLLKHSHHLVTHCSSSCFEALTFGKPTTFIDPLGRRHFAEQVEAGHFRHAASAGELLASIRRDYTPEELAGLPRPMDPGLPAARAALGRILAASPNQPRPLPSPAVAGRPAAFWAQALHAEGARLLQAKRFAQAGEVFQRLAVLSRGRLGHHGLGAALAGLGRREEAAASLRQELAANPGNQAAQRLLDQIAAPAARAAAL